MESAVFLHDGRTIDYTPVAETPSGTVVVIEDLIGIVTRDLKAAELGALVVEGVFDVVKATSASTALDGGVKVYWNEASGQVSATDGGGIHKLLGKTVEAATDDDETVRVRLTQ